MKKDIMRDELKRMKATENKAVKNNRRNDA